MGFDVMQFKDADSLAFKAANDWMIALRRLNQSGQPYGVALSGGRVAGKFFSALAHLAKGELELFRPVHFFWGDERCVPPTDSQSNFALARKNFLEPAALEGERVHRIRGEAPPEAAAAEAETELRRVMPADPESQPVLDLIFLGMGEDGHVASLFPGESEEARASRAVFRAVVGPKPPPRRITLGYPAIAAAKEVWVMASGQGKEDAFRKSLAPNGSTPLGLVLQSRRKTLILTDIQ